MLLRFGPGGVEMSNQMLLSAWPSSFAPAPTCDMKCSLRWSVLLLITLLACSVLAVPQNSRIERRHQKSRVADPVMRRSSSDTSKAMLNNASHRELSTVGVYHSRDDSSLSSLGLETQDPKSFAYVPLFTINPVHLIYLNLMKISFASLQRNKASEGCAQRTKLGVHFSGLHQRDVR